MVTSHLPTRHWPSMSQQVLMTSSSWGHRCRRTTGHHQRQQSPAIMTSRGTSTLWRTTITAIISTLVILKIMFDRSSFLLAAKILKLFLLTMDDRAWRCVDRWIYACMYVCVEFCVEDASNCKRVGQYRHILVPTIIQRTHIHTHPHRANTE